MNCRYCGQMICIGSNWCSNCGKFISLSTGTILNERFEIEKIIADGGMGIIYLAHDNQFAGNKIAIKELTFENLKFEENEKIRTMFMDEANLLNQITHQNIPKVISFFIHNNRYYLVMDYIQGDNLEYSAGKHKYQEKEIVIIAQKICEILNFLHTLKKPIIHQDIKPSNIIINNNEDLYLVDFGTFHQIKLNGSTQYITRKTSIFGTPGFNAPETSCGNIFPQSDIYSLGMTIVWLLTGDVNREKFIETKPCSDNLFQIISQCIDFEYKNRPDAKKLFKLLTDNSSLVQTKCTIEDTNYKNMLITIRETIDRDIQDIFLLETINDIIHSYTNQNNFYDIKAKIVQLAHYLKYSGSDQVNKIHDILYMSVYWRRYNEYDISYVSCLDKYRIGFSESIAQYLINNALLNDDLNVIDNIFCHIEKNTITFQYRSSTARFLMGLMIALSKHPKQHDTIIRIFESITHIKGDKSPYECCIEIISSYHDINQKYLCNSARNKIIKCFEKNCLGTKQILMCDNSDDMYHKNVACLSQKCCRNINVLIDPINMLLDQKNELSNIGVELYYKYIRLIPKHILDFPCWYQILKLTDKTLRIVVENITPIILNNFAQHIDEIYNILKIWASPSMIGSVCAHVCGFLINNFDFDDHHYCHKNVMDIRTLLPRIYDNILHIADLYYSKNNIQINKHTQEIIEKISKLSL